MKKIKILFGLAVVLLSASCTKETTIKEEYNPPQASLYGTWKQIFATPTTNETYYVFNNDGSNFSYFLSKDQYGFKTKESYPFKATDKQVNVSYYLYNYTVVNDTLTLYQTPSSYTRYLKVANPTFTPTSWTSSLKVLRNVELPRGVNYNTVRSFGIDGDFLYLCGYNGMGYYVYKFNSLTNQYTDSLNVPNVATTYYKSPYVYYGFDASNKIFKTTGLAPSSADVSSNNIDYTYSLSMNPNSGVFYAFNVNQKLFSGTEGSNFNLLFDFNTYGASYVMYDKNDEFIGLKNGAVTRMKISPTFSVISNFDQLSNYYTYVLSSNGTDTWLFCYNNNTSSYQLVKVSLN